MKKNSIYILLVIVVVASAFYLYKSKSKGTIANSLKDFSVEDTASITKINIVAKNGSALLLDKQDNKTWKVNGLYQARTDMIAVLLETLKRVEVKSPVNKTMRDKLIKQMSSSAVRVQVFKGKSEIKTFYVGGATQDGLGTFMLLEGADEPFITHIPGFDGYLSTRFSTDGELWRDRAVFRYAPPSIDLVKVDYANNPQNSFTLRIQDKNYIRLVNNLGDTAKGNINGEFLRQYLDQFSNINYESSIALRQSLRDSVLIPANWIATISVYDKKGQVKYAKLFQRYYNGLEFAPTGNEAEYDHERYFVLTDNNMLVNGQRRIFDPLLVKYNDFFGVPKKSVD